MEITKQNFNEERQQTDKSLTLERGKTDESFENGRGDAQNITDEIVSKDRLTADEDRLQRRTVTDLKRDDLEADLISSKGLAETVARALDTERKFEDKAIESERTNMDAALEQERGEKVKLMNKLVSQEREATDKNLMGERLKTDAEVEKATELLNVEHAAHAETKTALTTREEFVAIVSHDLRNPIGAILSSTEILLDATSIFGISDEGKSLIELIKRNAETSLRLISDILDMERIVEGKIQLQLQKNSVSDLLRESVESFSYAASKKKISLKVSALNTIQEIICDKDRVIQILSNLIGNAIKFTPPGGSVNVEALQADNEIKISVCDTGPGIADDQKLRIFERFAQIGNKQRGGLGLGLYISKTLVESHFGKLWVTSEQGIGSTFWFTLPVHKVL